MKPVFPSFHTNKVEKGKNVGNKQFILFTKYFQAVKDKQNDLNIT